jgi:alkylation response protein AidB-like acyl-CoA dehydrogenase
MVESGHVKTGVIDGELSRVLLSNADKTEQQNRPAAESLTAVRQAGGFALRSPVVHGGAWATPETVAAWLTELGRACPSTAWIVGTCVTAKTVAANVLGDSAAAKELFADPDVLACGSGLPTGRGVRRADGVLVNGRWANVSGCEDAMWAGLAIMVDGAYTFAFIPVADLTVEQTWHMAGMRGTGSHTLVAEDLLVPARFVAPTDPFTPSDLLLFALTVVGPVVGAARGALDLTNAMFASDRKPARTAYSRMGDSPGARQWLAEATYLVERAELAMLDVSRAHLAADDPTSRDPLLHLALAEAGRDCRAAVDRMLDLHGASGFGTANPLQRYWRDVAVGSRHPHFNPYLAYENLGTTLTTGGQRPPTS